MNESLLQQIDDWANTDITLSPNHFYIRLIAKLLQEVIWAENIIKEKEIVIKNLYEKALSLTPERQHQASEVCHYCHPSFVPASLEASVQQVEQCPGELVPSVA
jgi:hypothetical protein